MSQPSLPERITAVHRALDDAEVPHAFGGAVALAYYAAPRATVDIDLNVFLNPIEHERVSAALTPLGVDVEADPVRLERAGQCRVWWDRTPLDLFYAYDPVHEAMRDAVRLVPFLDTTIPILGPEHLVVCKAAFDRPKDWLDIEQVLTYVDVDVNEIRRWLGRIVGTEDHRYRRFDETSRELRAE